MAFLLHLKLLIHVKKRNTPATILKLDFHETFDSVSWNFLDWSLSQLGFPKEWLKWINACVSSASTSILVNGSPTPPIKLQKGLRQGWPLVTIPLRHHRWSATPCDHKGDIHKALVRYWDCSRGGIKISHLKYTDDTIISCPQNLEFLKNTKKLIPSFIQASCKIFIRVLYQALMFLTCGLMMQWKYFCVKRALFHSTILVLQLVASPHA